MQLVELALCSVAAVGSWFDPNTLLVNAETTCVTPYIGVFSRSWNGIYYVRQDGANLVNEHAVDGLPGCPLAAACARVAATEQVSLRCRLTF